MMKLENIEEMLVPSFLACSSASAMISGVAVKVSFLVLGIIPLHVVARILQNLIYVLFFKSQAGKKEKTL